MNGPPVACAVGEIVQAGPGGAVVIHCAPQVGVVSLVLQERQKPVDRATDVADHAQGYVRPPSDLLRADIHLGYARSVRGIELLIRKVRAEHKQHVAVAHGVIARREADQPRHAHTEGIVVLHVLLALERVHHGGL